jgi:hypothetical protein
MQMGHRFCCFDGGWALAKDQRADADKGIVGDGYPATSGQVVLFGQDVTSWPSHRRTALGIPPLRQIIAVIASNYDESRNVLLNSIFLEALKELTARGDGNGILHIWFRTEIGKMVADMDISVLDAVMENLLLTPRLDYQAEHILTAIAARSPEKVIEFFGKRIMSKKEDELGSRYEAFPFQFHELQKPLAKIPKKAVDIVTEWYDGNYGLFIVRGGKLLSNIFPDFPEPFEKKLIEFVKSGDNKKLSVVLAVLRNYEGNPAIHRVCKELVKALPDDSIELRAPRKIAALASLCESD